MYFVRRCAVVEQWTKGDQDLTLLLSQISSDPFLDDWDPDFLEGFGPLLYDSTAPDEVHSGDAASLDSPF